MRPATSGTAVDAPGVTTSNADILNSPIITRHNRSYRRPLLLSGSSAAACCARPARHGSNNRASLIGGNQSESS